MEEVETQTSPWQVIGSREVYVNPWIQVREDQVIRPDGKPGIYGVVHFPTYALGVVPLAENGDTFLVGQYRYTLDAYSWEIPEGGGDKALPMLESIQRELREETGITADEWVDLGPLHTSNSVTDETGRVYLARGLQLGAAHPDGDEVIQVRRLSLEEVYAMCMDGRITDSVTVIGVTRARHFLAGEAPVPPELAHPERTGAEAPQPPILGEPESDSPRIGGEGAGGSVSAPFPLLRGKTSLSEE